MEERTPTIPNEDKYLSKISKEDFAKPSSEFDPNVIIRQYLKVNLNFQTDQNQILKHLSHQLSIFLADSKNKIIAILNSKKEEFFTLATRLDKITRQARLIEQMLNILSQYAKNSSTELFSGIQKIAARIKEISIISADESKYTHLIQANNLLQKAKQYIKNINMYSGASLDDRIGIQNYLDCSCLQQMWNQTLKLSKCLQSLIVKKEILFSLQSSILHKQVQKMNTEVEDLSLILTNFLNAHFVRILRSPIAENQDELVMEASFIMKCYNNINLKDEIYKTIKKEILSSRLPQIFEEMKKLQTALLNTFSDTNFLTFVQSSTKFEESQMPFQFLFQEIKEMLGNGILKALLDITVFPKSLEEMERIKEFVSGINLVEEGLWPYLFEQMDCYSYIFAPTIPFSFQYNYHKTVEMISYLNGFTNSEDEGPHCEWSSKFLKKFELRTYFQLLYMEVIDRMEIWIQSDEEAPKKQAAMEENKITFHNQILPLIKMLFNPEVYIKEISNCYLCLTIQIINRYTNYILQKLQTQTSHSPPLKKDESQDEAQSQTIIITGENILLLVGELSQIEISIGEELSDFLLERLSFKNNERKEQSKILIENMLDDVNKNIQNIIEPALQKLSEQLKERLFNNFESIKSVVSIYRMTNKELSNSPSHYVQTLFQPLDLVLDHPQFIHLSNMTRSRFIGSILEFSFSHIYEIIQQILAQEKKMQESLKKFKKVETSQDISDLQKICTQLQIDIQECKNKLSPHFTQNAKNEIDKIFNLVNEEALPNNNFKEQNS